MYMPSDVNGIQPRDTQVWNCDEMEGGTSSPVITSSFKLTNVKGANWRAITILVQVTCLYLSQLEMLHATHNCAPSQGVIRLPSFKHSTGIGIPSHTIWLYG